VTDDIVAGAVSYPHGWGHRGEWSTAVEHRGANVNTIIPNDVELKEKISGMSFIDGIPVDVVRAAADL
jgi:formate dehydrogenase